MSAQPNVGQRVTLSWTATGKNFFGEKVMAQVLLFHFEELEAIVRL